MTKEHSTSSAQVRHTPGHTMCMWHQQTLLSISNSTCSTSVPGLLWSECFCNASFVSKCSDLLWWNFACSWNPWENVWALTLSLSLSVTLDWVMCILYKTMLKLLWNCAKNVSVIQLLSQNFTTWSCGTSDVFEICSISCKLIHV